MTRRCRGGPAPIAIEPALAALRGTVAAKPYDSRAAARAASNPDCSTLPIVATMGVSPDVVAQHAHAVGLGPDPRRSMSQLARQQGDTYDSNVLTDGRPLLEPLHAEGYLDTVSIAVVNVNDHVNPPTAAGLTGNGGKPNEQQWRHYHQQRERYTRDAHARALAAPTPTLLLRGVVETTQFAGTPLRAFGEFDFAIIYPLGSAPPDPAVREAFGLPEAAEHDGITVLGDAKSWRKLGRLDNGDKRAAVAVQVALYSAAGATTWPAAQAATVRPVGLIANPPSTGGLATVKLTRVDLSDPLRTLHAAADRRQQVVATAIPQIAEAVAHGAQLDLTDPAATIDAIDALLAFSAWNPGCLSRCPLGQICRRAVADHDSTTRLGPLSTQAAPVATMSRLHVLQGGASPTPSEAEVAASLATGTDLLGAPVPLPWTPVIPARPGPRERG